MPERVGERAGLRFLWPGLIVLAVLVANAPGILGITDVNPIDSLAGLTVSQGAHLVPGASTIDINVGATSQALGHRAALDWLSGHVPWWNPYEGVGTPLAAGMQSAAFFPLTLLLAWSGGQLTERLVLEVVAGLCTYFLLRKLGVREVVAGVGGVAFALDGTFAWFQHAAINPVAFLPAALLGVELARERPLGDRRTLLLPVSLALSVVAGFPETAFYDGLLVVLWAALRAAQEPTWEERGRVAGRLALLGVGGLLLTAPLVLPFRSYLAQSSVGAHTGMSHVHLPLSNIFTFVDPYLTGPLKAFVPPGNASIQNLFITNSGYVTVSGFVLAVAGLVLGGRRQLGLRILLAVWVLAVSLRDFGLRPLQQLLAHVPYVSESAIFRSAVPAVELAFVVLAALGIEAWLGAGEEGGLVRRRLALPLVSLAVAALLAGLSAGPSRQVLHLVWSATTAGAASHPYIIGAYIGSAVVLAALMFGGALRGRAGQAVVCSVFALEAVGSFVYPELAGARHPVVDTRPVAYLAAHQGSYRFYSLFSDPAVGGDYGGPIAPNYGSYFGLPEVDYLDIPDPAQYVNFVHDELDPGAGDEFFGTEFGRRRGAPGTLTELKEHVRTFEEIGVRYIVTGARVPLKSYVPTATRVYLDGLVGIWRLPGATPYFSTLHGSCRLKPEGFETVVASCSGPAVVQRAELALPGWSVSIDGRPARLTDGRLPIFSAVGVPGGTSTITWSYRPPHLRLGELLAAFGFLLLVAPFVWRGLGHGRGGGRSDEARRHSRRHSRHRRKARHSRAGATQLSP